MYKVKTTFKISRDVNGNKTVLVKVEDHRAFSIQTNGNLPETHRLGLGADIEKEVISYVSKFGTDHQKKLFDIQVFEYPLFWKGEEIDAGVSRKDARYLLKEYNMAYAGGVSLGRARRVS